MERKEFEYKGVQIIIDISTDDFTDSPRDWYNLGKMICFHKRYQLGDDHDITSEDFDSWDDVKKHLESTNSIVLIKPLYLYDHSGLIISMTPFSCPWDSGQIGYIYVTSEAISSWSDEDRTEEKMMANLESEVETYNHWIRGEVWYYEIAYQGKVLDSCYGIYLLKESDLEDLIVEIKSVIDSYQMQGQLNMFTDGEQKL